jgi:hypothetical protein
MALSAHEQEMLDQIERGLRHGVAKSTTEPLRAAHEPGRPHRRMLIVVASVAVGLALVLLGLISQTVVISVLGFVVIVAAATTSGANRAQLWSCSPGSAIGRVNPLLAAGERGREPGHTSDESSPPADR